MIPLSIHTLARMIHAAPPSQPSCTQPVTGVSTDSRTTRPGDCFFAIIGPKFDGHDFLADAFAKGAVCAVVSKHPPTQPPHDKPLLHVDDTTAALGRLAAAYRQHLPLTLIAVTGSVGKTTTRHMIAHILSQHRRTRQAPKSFNNHIGLPLTLLQAQPDDQVLVTEIGANKPGEIAHLTRIARPDIAVVTNVHPAHLQGFGDLQTIAKEKLSIAHGLQPAGTLIINGDYPLLLQLAAEQHLQPITFGLSPTCRFRATDVRHHTVSSFRIENRRLTLPVPGPGNVENALAAWAVARTLGLSADQIAQALETLPPIPMRAELLKIGTLTVLNDCYNANPASMQNALSILQQLNYQNKHRTVFICGDMAELGTHSDRLHAQLGDQIAQTDIQLLLTVGPHAALAANTAERKRAQQNRPLLSHCFQTTEALCNNLHKFIQPYDIIAIKGSRAVGLEKVAETLKELFG